MATFAALIVFENICQAEYVVAPQELFKSSLLGTPVWDISFHNQLFPSLKLRFIFSPNDNIWRSKASLYKLAIDRVSVSVLGFGIGFSFGTKSVYSLKPNQSTKLRLFKSEMLLIQDK